MCSKSEVTLGQLSFLSLLGTKSRSCSAVLPLDLIAAGQCFECIMDVDDVDDLRARAATDITW